MIVLVNPPSPVGFVSNKDTMGGLGQLYPFDALTKIPPLDIPYCAAVLRERGIPFEIVECLGLSLDKERYLSYIGTLGADIIAIRTSLPTFDWDLQLAELTREKTGARLILFGPCTTYLYQEALQHHAIDGVLLGEPELVIAEIAASGFDAQHPHLMKKEQSYDSLPEASFVDDLDLLPFPAWDLMPYGAYSAAEMVRNLTPFVTMLASRGCVHGCLYCPYPATQGKRLRYHSVKRILEELKWLQSSLGIRAVLFRDPEFAINRDRIVELCEGIIALDIKIAWRCETRIENLNPELVTLMSKAGCIGLNMGIESFNEETLGFLGRKHLSVGHAASVILQARKVNIDTFCFFILGLPGETIKSSLRTISTAVKLGCDHLQFTAATPYPGTRLFDWAIENGYLETQSRSLLTGYDPVMQNGHLSCQDISELRTFAEAKWVVTQMRNQLKYLALMGRLRLLKLGLALRFWQIRLLRRAQILGE